MEEHNTMAKRENISMSVIRRLPRYYRFLRQLRETGVTRISSTELSVKLGLTASQIRQDLNCFGGFGQQPPKQAPQQGGFTPGQMFGQQTQTNPTFGGNGQTIEIDDKDLPF